MSDRYLRRRKLRNSLGRYKKTLFKNRNVSEIVMYETAEFRHPTPEEISQLTLEPVRWQLGDKFFKIAHDFYGDAELWWVIAWFNKTPTDGHLEIGDMIYVPLPLEKIISFYEL
jgi:hypothetical protein